MARNYDDYSNSSSDNSTSGSARLVLAFILLAALICVAAVLVWSSMKKSSDSTVTETGKEAVVQKTADTAETAERIVVEDSFFEMPEVHSDYAVEDYEEEEAAPVVYDTDAVPAVAVSLSDASSEVTSSIVPVSYTEHTVQEGESVAQIAASYGISIKTIYAVNSIRRAIAAGDILIIPDRNGTVYQVSSGDTLSSIVVQLGLKITAGTLKQVNGLESDDLIEGTRLFIPSDEYYLNTSEEAEGSYLSFSLPVNGAVITGLFNQVVSDPITGESVVLDGVLLSCPNPSDVMSALGGTVVDIIINSDGSYGVKFTHAGGYTSFINYLTDVSVSVSQRVSANEKIGSVSSYAENTSAIIFFRIELEGNALNPTDFINKSI
ncbi:MAG: LysM peptidoglycan-binding domain-containing protein [Sphaerochaetaceae bacterium]|nr:LysM peptidoglycan-binding domain-containing protein [Sphaerochaetaceae bacterium]